MARERVHYGIQDAACALLKILLEGHDPARIIVTVWHDDHLEFVLRGPLGRVVFDVEALLPYAAVRVVEGQLLKEIVYLVN